MYIVRISSYIPKIQDFNYVAVRSVEELEVFINGNGLYRYKFYITSKIRKSFEKVQPILNFFFDLLSVLLRAVSFGPVSIGGDLLS